MHLGIKALTGILALACVWVPLSPAQQQPARSESTRRVQMGGIEMAVILANIAADYKTVIGLEVDPDKPRSPITIDLRDVNFLQIVDGVVKAEPRYRWRENDGSIEVFPVKGSSSLFETPIQSFQVKDVNRVVAINRLLSVPEVQARSSSMNLTMRAPHAPSEQIKDEKLSFDLSGVTLRQALNRIAAESGTNFWAFRRYPDSTFEVRLSCC